MIISPSTPKRCCPRRECRKWRNLKREVEEKRKKRTGWEASVIMENHEHPSRELKLEPSANVADRILKLYSAELRDKRASGSSISLKYSNIVTISTQSLMFGLLASPETKERDLSFVSDEARMQNVRRSLKYGDNALCCGKTTKVALTVTASVCSA